MNRVIDRLPEVHFSTSKLFICHLRSTSWTSWTYNRKVVTFGRRASWFVMEYRDRHMGKDLPVFIECETKQQANNPSFGFIWYHTHLVRGPQNWDELHFDVSFIIPLFVHLVNVRLRSKVSLSNFHASGHVCSEFDHCQNLLLLGRDLPCIHCILDWAPWCTYWTSITIRGALVGTVCLGSQHRRSDVSV